MTGIFSSFVCTGATELFFVACDMPFIGTEVIELIKKKFHGQDAVIPVHQGLPHALLGIYSRQIVPVLERRMRQNRKAMWDLSQEISAELIPEREISEADPEGRSFVNINTLEEFRDIIIPG
jgi:molybdopterin-guanine dinucleotide biosynthesis protein A